MSYLDSFYYPYYSARNEPPPALAHRLHRPPLQTYARQVAIEAEVEREIDHRVLREEAEARLRQLQAEDLEYQYYDRISALRRERDLLQANQGGGTVVNSMLVPSNEQMITDEQLIKYYQNGERKQQYADQLKASYSPHLHQSPLVRIMQGKEPGTVKDETHGRQALNKTKKHEKKQEKVRKSYDHTLKTSKHFDLEHNVFLQSPKRGKTLDMYQMGAINKRNPGKHKERKRSKSNRVINRSVAPIKGLALAPQAAEPAIQRINNRVKVSEMIYIDSRLRNKRHEVDHLLNTYQCEIRLRKEVKDKINNHPGTLKKHKMVAESR